MEAELLNKIADLELQNQQLKEVMPQAFAALEGFASRINEAYLRNNTPHEEESDFPTQGDFKMAERTLKWLEQFRQKEEGK